MGPHLKALIGILIALGVVAGVGLYFFRPTQVPEESFVDVVEKMKKEGVPLIDTFALSGEKVGLEQFKGKIVIINFWASWCTPCIEEVPSLISLIEKMAGDVVLLAISGDSAKEEIDSFLRSFPGLKNKSIHLIWDQSKSLVKSYGVERLPETFIVGKDSKLVKKVAGSVRWDHPESVDFFKRIHDGLN